MHKALFSLILSFSLSLLAQADNNQPIALQNIQRAIDIAEASWRTSMKGDADNLYMADRYNTITDEASGPADVWPYTAAIEAHCSILEALNAIKRIAPKLYDANFTKFKTRLDHLISNLEYYRGTYTLSSYASCKQWSVFAVPRAKQRGAADVSGILNVYDDQMWLARELIRAYRITNNKKYLAEATYLTDYVLDGWDCWRNENGEEYGGITWGPGYNSKHACSNAPIIQSLVWLADIYKNSYETINYAHRHTDNSLTIVTRTRAEHYLDFAKRVYNWQKTNLRHSSGVYWDMMGADNTITVKDGYRQHMRCGHPTGNFFSYNTGTMIAGAAELFRATNNETYRTEMSESVKASLNQFAKYIRDLNTYEFISDKTAENGFNTWFNNVLMRALVDAAPITLNNSAKTALTAFQTNLDYAFEHHNRHNMLPIHLLNGWGDEAVTKAFHQFSFAAEYAILALWHLNSKS